MTLRRKTFAIAFAVLMPAWNAVSQQDEAAQIQLAMNNASNEFTTCAAYFLVVSVAMENSSKPDLAKQYKGVSDRSLEYAATSAKVAGLLDETIAARFENDFVEMTKRIGGNTSNISILWRDHADLCQTVMQRPDDRLRYWVDEIKKRN